MNLLPRRTAAQLTPLLDLLLIVIFAQYMDVRQTSELTVQDSINAQQLTDAEMSRLRTTISSLQTQLDISNGTLDAAITGDVAQAERLKELKNENANLQSELKRVQQQRNSVASLAQELFRIPNELIMEAARAPSSTNSEKQNAQDQKLQAEIRRLAKNDPALMIRHLLTYQELRKRCDLWQVHIQENGVIEFRDGKKVVTFRATSAQEFQTRAFAIYKSLPQPKSLVIIMVSYGDARADVRSAVTNGLPTLTERMRTDTSGRARFEYAILGYQPDRKS